MRGRTKERSVGGKTEPRKRGRGKIPQGGRRRMGGLGKGLW